MRVRWTRRALQRLEEIGDHTALDNPAAASRVVAAIGQKVETLAAHPHLGRVGRVAGTRELVIGGTPYLVAYRIRGQQIAILAVFHGAQRWPTAL
ncbi:type II toxin-antitoxin system RelE/ParE family toxin [Inquilinus sp.]|jgi:toxin ParE1/3/4|uniref:type II toxin-antitoxin system RelE/ParE family toxin n=1 Tax=Inquilinus sp. TaxID=1932117 RepID=UPI0037845A1A